MLSTVNNMVSSETVKVVAKDLYHKILDVLNLDPIAALDLIKDLKNLPSTIRDGIFFECFEAYILNLNEYDHEKKAFVEDNLKKLVISLTEASPNDETDYVGDSTKLYEYAKRIVKLIDDCGTIQKAVYLSNISRALAKHEIDKRLFFKLGQCIRMLTEEDLLFLRENVKEGIISGEGDYIDDFRGLGLMYEVDTGFAYSKKAFQLLKYALDYEGRSIPEKFPERNIITAATKDEIKEAMEKVDEIDGRTKWGKF
ncbi:hypothetical protein B5E77_16465 [Lachnoclostridium sp. An131]|uniref:hypothetical protein n=1 Tax=Lachnoclostridium sp. An131 TaxID=1965555 RepID=UPI000B37B2F3|nr:hypothetical protein [Lachnoclostridium sp. An131]OUQ22673.1 hypothetical protein B5E77_16465 [Lachnoclostridium sp. An131]